jgi:hypothetical protein
MIWFSDRVSGGQTRAHDEVKPKQQCIEEIMLKFDRKINIR